MEEYEKDFKDDFKISLFIDEDEMDEDWDLIVLVYIWFVEESIKGLLIGMFNEYR